MDNMGIRFILEDKSAFTLNSCLCQSKAKKQASNVTTGDLNSQSGVVFVNEYG